MKINVIIIINDKRTNRNSKNELISILKNINVFQNHKVKKFNNEI